MKTTDRRIPGRIKIAVWIALLVAAWALFFGIAVAAWG
tara:strand:- start:850 stop:963 length:114 start_codon:yes stop_codon:yes gene_type:complete